MTLKSNGFLVMVEAGVYIVANYDDSNNFPCFWDGSEMYEPVAWMEFNRY